MLAFLFSYTLKIYRKAQNIEAENWVAAALANPNFHVKHQGLSLKEYNELTRVEATLNRNIAELLKDRKHFSLANPGGRGDKAPYCSKKVQQTYVDRKTYLSYNVKLIVRASKQACNLSIMAMSASIALLFGQCDAHRLSTCM